LLLTGCDTQPVSIDHEQISKARASHPASTKKKLPCKIEWQGLTDKRTTEGPIGYLALHAIQFPELVDELDRQFHDTTAGAVITKKSAPTLRVSAELLRAYAEQRANLAVLNMWFRIQFADNSREPVILSSAAVKTVMTGSRQEMQDIMRWGTGESVDQLLTQLGKMCADH
jgi:hypothetical protein